VCNGKQLLILLYGALCVMAGWIAPPTKEDEEKELLKSLAKAKKKIEKNMKIQEWLQDKESRVSAAQQQEDEERAAMEAAGNEEALAHGCMISICNTFTQQIGRRVNNACSCVTRMQLLNIIERVFDLFVFRARERAKKKGSGQQAEEAAVGLLPTHQGGSGEDSGTTNKIRRSAYSCMHVM
jgi:hypothetical protein